MGGMAVDPFKGMPSLPVPKPEKPVEKPVEKPKPVVGPPKPTVHSEPHELTALGGDDFYLKVLLNSKGAGSSN